MALLLHQNKAHTSYVVDPLEIYCSI